jgi:hypothetical protein
MDCFASNITDAVRRASATAPHSALFSFTLGPGKHHDCGACTLLDDLLEVKLSHIQNDRPVCLALRVDLKPHCTVYLTDVENRELGLSSANDIPLLTISARKGEEAFIAKKRSPRVV